MRWRIEREVQEGKGWNRIYHFMKKNNWENENITFLVLLERPMSLRCSGGKNCVTLNVSLTSCQQS